MDKNYSEPEGSNPSVGKIRKIFTMTVPCDCRLAGMLAKEVLIF